MDEVIAPEEKLIYSEPYGFYVYNYRHKRGGEQKPFLNSHPVVTFTFRDDRQVGDALELFADKPILIGTQAGMREGVCEGWGINDSGSICNDYIQVYAEIRAERNRSYVMLGTARGVTLIRGSKEVHGGPHLLQHGDRFRIEEFPAGEFGFGYMSPQRTWPAMPIGRAIAEAGRQVGSAFLAKFRGK